MTTSVAEETGSAPDAGTEHGPRLTHRQIVTILIGLMSGMFLASLDQTIVGTSIVRIANDLNGFDLQAWITTAYLITSTIATPIYGKLSDIYGRKPFYLIAIAIFVVGSIAATFSQSMYELAAFRALQGIGAGGLMSLAMTILGDIVPPRERAKYQGFFLAVFGTSTVLGPVLGGFFADFDVLFGIDGWRWVFLVNVPIGVIALAVVAKVLNVPHERQEQRIDWWGGLALVLCVVPLLVIAEQGAKWGWGSTSAIACYIIAAVGLLLFLFVENRMQDEALIPLRLFKNATFSVAILGGIIVGVAMFGAITMIPQYLQVVQGYTPTESGLMMLPLMLGVMSASIITGVITGRTGRYKIFPVLGTLLIALGSLLFAQVEYDTEIWQPMVFACVIGLGLGSCMQTLVIAVQNAGPRRDMGVSTAASTFFRQMGGTMGVAVFLTILFNVLPGNIEKAFGGSVPGGGGGQLGNIQSNTAVIATLPDQIRIPVLIGFTDSINTVFYVASGVAMLAFVVLLFMKEIPLSGGPSAASAAMEGGEALLDEDSDDAVPIHSAAYSGGKHAKPDDGVGVDDVPVTGLVRRADGTPVGGALLTLIDQRGGQVGRATAAADGSYAIGAPEPGNYVLIVSASAYQPQASSLRIGAEPASLDVTLTGSGEVLGVVRDSREGTPLPAVAVTLADERGEVTGSVTTADDGAYRFYSMNAGTYTLVASAERYQPVAVAVAVPESGQTRYDVDLSGAVRLAGTARTDAGEAVQDARITVLDAEGNVIALTQTDADGRYAIDDVQLGEYTVVASGYLPSSSRVTLVDGDDAKHDVHLSHERAPADPS